MDLAVYDEIQWQKIMHEIYTLRDYSNPLNMLSSAKKSKWANYEPMTCEERLSHAIHIDKIKIYPNSSVIIEKTTRRNI
jgi:hypothetical protein